MTSPLEREPEQQRLGEFTLLREIGRGGMGIVYEALQVSLNRRVALKVMAGGLGLTPKAVQRFHREAQAAAKMHHTNIVPVYATGEANGTHFYAMELIDGPSLDRVLAELRPTSEGRDGPAKPRQAALGELEATGPFVDPGSPTSALTSSALSSDSRYFDTVARMIAEVADALDHAHKNGVIHRDIKPSNLLLAADGRLSVNDFGLARLLEEAGMTLTGEFVGTPAYMSPEQITAGRVPTDHRTDIYSLGATLYELLTLQRPFGGEHRDEVLAQILQKEPLAPRRLNKRVPVDLETICLKCLEKDPDRRYQTAGALAEDLRRYVNRFAISARRTGAVGCAIKWVRRRPGLSAALAAAGFLALGLGFFACQASLSERRRLKEQDEAEARLLAEQRQNALDKALLVAMSGDLDEAEKAVAEAERLGASNGQVRMLRGQIALHRGNATEAIRELDQAVELLPESVAVRAMRAMTYYNLGQAERGLELLADVEPRACITPEDFLFKGYCEFTFSPGRRAVAALDEAYRRRPSLIARAIRGEVLAGYAMDTADPADAESAVNDVNAVKQMLPGNVPMLLRSLNAQMTAMNAYERTGQREKAQAAAAEARRDAQALAPFSNLPEAVGGRWQYFWYVGELDKVSEEVRHCSDEHPGHWLYWAHTLNLYRRGEIKQAVDFFDKHRTSDGFWDYVRCWLLAELPDATNHALDAYKELVERSPGGLHLVYDQTVLRFLGRKREAVAASIVCRQQAERLPILGRDFYQKTLDYNCEVLSEADYLTGCRGSMSDLCRAHAFVGLTKLAEGDRLGARQHFQKSVATRAYSFATWYESQIFLERMDRDQKWPRWIPVKGGDDQPGGNVGTK